ncbi:type II 3-dehydroquinate dehydratase [soil metagenome]
MAGSSRNRVEVMHGVNLDQLGRRNPLHYGTMTLNELEVQVGRFADDLGLRTGFFQTNHEGEFVEYLHRLPERSDGVILNCGAWTHYSWAIRDALEASGVPAVEVHLSDIQAREEWRKVSVFDGLVLEQISGLKEQGYKQALQRLAKELGT